jgi:nucleoside-diphosphate kinase
MTLERTLSIIKPDAVGKNQIGQILTLLEKAGLKVVAARMAHLTKEEAEGFYAVHKARPFFQELVTFMCSGPVLIMVLEGENAIGQNRKVMGATNPKDAEPGTIRNLFAASVGENAVHGSDAPDTAKTEIAYFFSEDQICPRKTAKNTSCSVGR